jgi:hypothetical protein
MDWPVSSASTWKVALCAFALCMSAFWLTEVWHAPRTLASGAAGTLGMVFHELPQPGRARFVIDEIAPDSPMRLVGAQIGDQWIPDRASDAHRRLEAHERIGLTLIQGDTPGHVVVEARSDRTPTDAWLYISGWFISLTGLLLGLIIGFRQPNSTAFRALALFMILMGAFKAIPTYLILPMGPAFLAHHVLWGPGFMLDGILLLVFFFNFPDDQPRNTAAKRWMLRYLVPPVVTLMAASAAALVARALGYHVPVMRALALGASPAFVLVALSVLWENWRTSRGDLRERHLWIMLAFGLLSVVPPTVFAISGLTPQPQLTIQLWWVARTITLVFLLLFGYAALRHRVVSIGFAVNRAVVYGAASVGMLLSFGLLEWAVHHFLESIGREKSVWLDAAIALGVFLIFHRLRHWGEQLIERLFFHASHAKEAALRRFVREAPFITRPDALLTAFTGALDRFTDGAGHALYRRSANGDYGRVAATLEAAPERVDADEPLAVALRARQQASHVSDAHSGLPGELALPSIHHGELDGFVLLGLKPNGDSYRPDEKDVLGFAAHQVGLDFRALRMELLEREVTELTISNRHLQSSNADLRMAVQRLGASSVTSVDPNPPATP